MRTALTALAFVTLFLGTRPAEAACPASGNATPQFTAGGNVFQRNSAQWNAYFGAKVTQENGCSDNQTLNTPALNNALIVNPTIVGAGITNLGIEPGTLTVSGSTSSQAISALYDYVETVNGSYSGSQPTAVNTFFINSFGVNSTGNVVENTRVYTNIGGSNQVGGFTNFDSVFSLNTTTGNLTNAFYQAGNFSANATVNDNGTSGTSSGSIYALNGHAYLKSGATYFAANGIMEGDTYVAVGASVDKEYGYKYELGSPNAVAPNIEQIAFDAVADTGATPTMTCLLCVGTYSGYNPLASTASLVGYSRHSGTGSYPQATISYGIDLYYFDTTAAAWRGPNGTSLIDAAGNGTFNSLNPGTSLIVGADGTHNGFQFNSSTATSAATLEAYSTVNTNWPLELQPQGTAAVAFLTSANGLMGTVSQDGTQSATPDYIAIRATAGSGSDAAYLTTLGSDSNVSMILYSKGTASVVSIGAGGDNPLTANSDLEIDGGSTPTSWLTVAGSTSGTPTLNCHGSGCLVSIPNLVLNQVFGTITSQSGTTYTFAASDCGTEVAFTSASAVTATIPATLPASCNIAILQAGAGTVAVNGSAVAAATLKSYDSYTGTAGQFALIGINISSNVGGSSAVAILSGRGA